MYFVLQSIMVSSMPQVDEALAEIRAIRVQIARGSEFHGYGPLSVAASGLLALLFAAAQGHWPDTLARSSLGFVAGWIAVAATSLLLTGTETLMRTRRVHSGSAQEMIQSAAEQFLPAIMTGLLLTAVLGRFTPGNSWMLPGLWQLLFSLGIFASCRFLPRHMSLAGIWYVASGLSCLAMGPPDASLSPWEMGIPFGAGQLLTAGVLQFGYRGDHGRK